MTAMPAHYLRQFHKTHNPDVVQLAEEEEFADWIALFFAPDHPAVDTAHPLGCHRRRTRTGWCSSMSWPRW
jgi:hypothetical protein